MNFLGNLSKNKTITVLNLVECRLILTNEAAGFVGEVSVDIPREFAG